MTEREKEIFDEYGTAYPCCGNCIHIREAGNKLICKKYLDYRDYNSVKCSEYSHQQHISELEELSYFEDKDKERNITREEEINKEAKSLYYHFCVRDSCEGEEDCVNCPYGKVQEPLVTMAKWADKHPSVKLVERIINLAFDGWDSIEDFSTLAQSIKEEIEKK